MMIQHDLAAAQRQHRHYQPHLIFHRRTSDGSGSAQASADVASDATAHAHRKAWPRYLHSLVARRVGEGIHISARLLGGNDMVALAVVDDATAAALCEQLNVAVHMPPAACTA